MSQNSKRSLAAWRQVRLSIEVVEWIESVRTPEDSLDSALRRLLGLKARATIAPQPSKYAAIKALAVGEFCVLEYTSHSPIEEPIERDKEFDKFRVAINRVEKQNGVRFKSEYESCGPFGGLRVTRLS